MKIPRINDLDYVYTYAQSTDKRSTNLLFTSMSGSTDIFQIDNIKQIVESPLYNQIMGNNSILFPYEVEPYPILLATTEFSERVATRMDQSKAGEVMVVCREGLAPETIDLYSTYYSCQLPQKLILGCMDCVQNPSNSKGCPLRQAATQALALEITGTDPEELVQILKSRQSAIGPFIYISPLLTSHEHFAKTIRTIEEHDFSFVEDRALIREKIIKSRTRLNAVKKHICPHCCVQDSCHSKFDYKYLRHRIRYCHGRYPETEELLVKGIIEQYPPTMTFEQMSTLLENSGELHKRYNRCISYATFTRARYGYGGCLDFAIVPRRGQRMSHICETYEEAISILKDYNGHVREPVRPMTPKQYALLLEAVRHTTSPAHRGMYHTAYYNTLYISPTYGEGVETHYTYNSHNSQVLPWSLVARHFGAFISHFHDLRTYERLPFNDADLKLRQDRR